MKEHMKQVHELANVRTQIKVLAELIANEDNYKLVRSYLEKLIELARREEVLTAFVKKHFMDDIERREKEFNERL